MRNSRIGGGKKVTYPTGKVTDIEDMVGKTVVFVEQEADFIGIHFDDQTAIAIFAREVNWVRFEVQNSITQAVISRNHTTQANAEAAAIRARKRISLDIIRIESDGDYEAVSYVWKGVAHPIDP